MRNILIHCQPSLLDYIQKMNFTWSYSPRFGDTEIDVIVPDVEYDLNHGLNDPDEQLCDHYGIDYNQVNMIEVA